MKDSEYLFWCATLVSLFWVLGSLRATFLLARKNKLKLSITDVVIITAGQMFGVVGISIIDDLIVHKTIHRLAKERMEREENRH